MVTQRKSKASGAKQNGNIDVYSVVRDMAISFQFQPGQRINEVELASQLGVSRTPLREAMQRLVSDKLMRWERNKGFFCRILDEKEVYDLYEYRQILEEQTARLACIRADDEQLLALKQFIDETSNADDRHELDKVLAYDQQFHERIAELSGNQELLSSLKKINQRIYFIRWIDMAGRRTATQSEHKKIIDALLKRDVESAVLAMSEHVGQRLEQIAEFVREAYGLIYTGSTPTEKNH